MSTLQVSDFLANSASGVIHKLPTLIQSLKADSIIEYTRPTRVEPTTVVDTDLIFLPYASEIMQSLNSIFTGYYLQAISLMVNVNNVDVIGLLDSLNPRRDVLSSNALGNLVQWGWGPPSNESLPLTFGLPLPTKNPFSELGLESRDIEELIYNLERKDDDNKSNSSNFKDIEFVNQGTNLSVGKIINVEISYDAGTVKIPVNVRLLVAPTPSKGIVSLLSMNYQNRTVKQRYHAWRSGQLEFWRDLVFVQDVIDEHRSGSMNDVSGLYQENVKRNRKNKISALLTLKPSVSNASNIIVISKDTEKKLEQSIYAKLSNFNDREKIFKNTYTMIIAVVDPEWEQVTFYHRSISRPTELSIKDIKSINRKNNGPDINEILKAFQTGQAPSF